MSAYEKILISILSTIGSGLATWLVKSVTGWLSAKRNEKIAATNDATINNVVADVVEQFMQVAVIDMKNDKKFDEAAKKDVFNSALVTIKNQLSSKIKKYIEKNFGDLDNFLETKIEAAILELKQI